MVSSLGLYITAILACYTPLSSLAIPLHRVRDTRTYIVKLKSGIAPGSHISSSSFSQYNERVYDSRVFNGYAIGLTPGAMDLLKTKYAEQIEYTEEDQIVHVASEIVQRDATWGLRRITQKETLPKGSSSVALNYTYSYDSSAGEGVDIYIFDTGVYIEHEEFGGRATHAPVFVPNSEPGDKFGHGTHCAGTAAGTRYGVAKKANIIDVKVLGDDGSGTTSGILDGLSWAVANSKSTNRPGVINMSLGSFGSSTSAQSDAVRQTIASGLTVVVAAGNQRTSATDWTPANVDEAIVVGNLDITGGQYWTSNYGPTLDLFAPGTDIISAGVTGPTDTQVDTGTSMAAPHVAGIAAYLLSLEGSYTPAELSARIISLAVPGVFNALSPNTTNLLRAAAQSILLYRQMHGVPGESVFSKFRSEWPNKATIARTKWGISPNRARSAEMDWRKRADITYKEYQAPTPYRGTELETLGVGDIASIMPSPMQYV